jgi:hypothetical protein
MGQEDQVYEVLWRLDEDAPLCVAAEAIEVFATSTAPDGGP